ncbi:hypothetical protein ABW19_dt0210303 [Dactylella cylindrospora]|nr:hypothetical protein ABW19_dt0210303 [Dactylella cylindrospora]
MIVRSQFEELKRKKQPTKKFDATASSAPAEKAADLDRGELERPPPHVNSDDTAAAPEEPSEVSTENLKPSTLESVADLSQTPNDHQPPVSNAEVVSERWDLENLTTARARHGRHHSITSSENTRYTDSYLSPTEPSPDTLPEIYRKQASTINELRAEKNHLLEEIGALRNEAQKAKEMMVARDKAIEDLASVSQELHTLKTQMGIDQATFREEAGEVNRLSIEISALNRQVSHLESQVGQRDKTIAEIRRESAAGPSSRLESTLKAKEEQIENMSVELSALRESLGKSDSSGKQFSLERDLLEAQLKSLRDRASEAEALAVDLREKLDVTSDSLAKEEATKFTYETKLRERESRIANLEDKVAEQETTINQMKESMNVLQNSGVKFNDLTRKFNNCQREKSDLQGRLSNLKSELQQSQKESQHLRELLKGRGTLSDGPSVGHSLYSDPSATVDGGFGVSSMTGNTSASLFSDVDLYMAPTNSTPPGHTARNPSVSENFDRRDSKVLSDKRYITAEIKNELMRWAGYKLDLRSLWRGYDDAYGRIFEV